MISGHEITSWTVTQPVLNRAANQPTLEVVIRSVILDTSRSYTKATGRGWLLARGPDDFGQTRTTPRETYDVLNQLVLGDDVLRGIAHLFGVTA